MSDTDHDDIDYDDGECWQCGGEGRVAGTCIDGCCVEQDDPDCPYCSRRCDIGEAAWINRDQPLRIYRLLWDGLCVGVGARHEVTAGQKRYHPSQKPEALMFWCLGFISGASILDPYMGAGSNRRCRRQAGEEIYRNRNRPALFRDCLQAHIRCHRTARYVRCRASKDPAGGFRTMRLVILESPYAGDIEANTLYARACVRDSLSRGEAPIASHLLYTQPGILRDDVAEERQWGIDAGLAWAGKAEATVVYVGRGISRGMEYGIANAERAGRPIEFRSIPAPVGSMPVDK